MKRRDFLISSCLTGGVALAASAAENESAAKQFIELRRYQLASMEKREALTAFLRDAAVPAWNRLGIKPVGIFQMLNDESPEIFVLLPHNTWESLTSANARLMADKTFVAAGKASLESPKEDPLYQRYTSSLLQGFDRCPRLEKAAIGNSREFQLRIYESHNLLMARRKIEMFNKGGEIDIFRRTGLNPVFFGEALVGDKLPNLTYMLSFENEQARKDAWKNFIDHSDWKKLSGDPYYKDTVSNITNLLLKPAVGSQL